MREFKKFVKEEYTLGNREIYPGAKQFRYIMIPILNKYGQEVGIVSQKGCSRWAAHITIDDNTHCYRTKQTTPRNALKEVLQVLTLSSKNKGK